MCNHKAEQYLRTLPENVRVADCYDIDENVREALATLIPEFEYPDWAYKTVGQVLRQVGAEAKADQPSL